LTGVQKMLMFSPQNNEAIIENICLEDNNT